MNLLSGGAPDEEKSEKTKNEEEKEKERENTEEVDNKCIKWQDLKNDNPGKRIDTHYDLREAYEKMTDKGFFGKPRGIFKRSFRCFSKIEEAFEEDGDGDNEDGGGGGGGDGDRDENNEDGVEYLEGEDGVGYNEDGDGGGGEGGGGNENENNEGGNGDGEGNNEGGGGGEGGEGNNSLVVTNRGNQVKIINGLTAVTENV